jgi:hypothetical protein
LTLNRSKQNMDLQDESGRSRRVLDEKSYEG